MTANADLGAPLRIPCEGSNLPGNVWSFSPLMSRRPVMSCQMCGRHFAGSGRVPAHDRDNLAMIERGDFNVSPNDGSQA
jgi:hypothetical protein